MKWYVDQSVEFQGNGSKDRPFGSISCAAAVAQPGDEVLVAPGVYREYVDPVNAGREDARIVYKSTEKNGAVITGAELLEGWKKDYCDLLLTDDPYKNQFATKETFDDCRANHPEMLVVAFVMNEEEIAAAISNPNGMVASDGIIAHGNGHPP